MIKLTFDDLIEFTGKKWLFREFPFDSYKLFLFGEKYGK